MIFMSQSGITDNKRLADWEAWLESVAIDRSTPYRGIAVVSEEKARAIGTDAGIAIYLPATIPAFA